VVALVEEFIYIFCSLFIRKTDTIDIFIMKSYTKYKKGKKKKERIEYMVWWTNDKLM